MIYQKLIAEKAGVSYATVSRAFTHSARVKPATMQKIRNAMQELGITDIDKIFMGNPTLSKTVLVVSGDITSEFCVNLISGIYEVLDRFGYSVTLCISKFEVENELRHMNLAAENGYAGIIMISTVETDEMVHFLRSSKIPVVLVNRYIRSLDMDVVRIDNYRGGYMAAMLLLENGHRRVAHLAGPLVSAAPQDRLRGFTDALHDHNVDFGPKDMIEGDLSRSSGRDFAHFLMKSDYTAAFIGNAYMTAGTAHQLIKSGLRIPDDISLICFDDSPIIHEDGLNITSVSYDPHLMGVSAAEVLLKRLDALLGDRMRIIYSPRLNMRESIKKINLTP